MSNQFVDTVKELRLIGWSEEGANSYAKLLDNNQLSIFSSDQYLAALTLFIFSLFILIYVSTKRYLEEQSKDLKLNNESNKSLEIKSKNKIPSLVKEVNVEEDKSKAVLNENKNFNKKSYNVFEEVPIDIDRVVDTIIVAGDFTTKLIGLSYKEFFAKESDKINQEGKLLDVRKKLGKKTNSELKALLGQANITTRGNNKNQLVNSILSNSKLIQKFLRQEREAFLLKKTNFELRAMLKGIENISRLKKIELVNRILEREFKP